MNIGFDLHNTIDKCPEMFELIMDTYKKSGHNVYVISGSEKNKIIDELNSLGIDDSYYSDIISVIDFLENDMNIQGWRINGEWYCDDDIWWRSKSIICEKYNIDMMIDDKKEYREHFGMHHKTRFILFNDNIEESIRNMNSICEIDITLVFQYNF